MSRFWLFMAAITAFLITWLPGKKIIKFLNKLKYGQTILEIGPSWHKKKQGTPTIGGIMFIIGIFISSIFFTIIYYFLVSNPSFKEDRKTLMLIRIIAGLLMALAYGLLGFLDDYIKITKKQNLGLKSKQKLVFQFLIAFIYLLAIHYTKITYTDKIPTAYDIPFIGTYDFGIFYWIFSMIMIAGMVNAVNLTDGIDGLNASVTFFVGLFLMIIANISGAIGFDILSASLMGGCIGFLMWNFHPAKVFMGDTGSLFLGGIICAIAFGLDKPVLLATSGLIYLIEMFSVMIQVLYFKATKGKRLFKMSPIHHHYEMLGWSESKICFTFSFVSLIGGILSLIIFVFGLNTK